MTTYYLVAAFVALLAGAVGWLAASVSLRSKIAGADSTIENLNREIANKESDLRLERDQCSRLAVAHAKLETELAQTRESLAEEEKRLADMKASFKAVSGEALKSSSEQFLNLAGQTFGKHVESIHGLLVPMKETLSRMEKDRVDASSVLREQLKELTKTTTGLETALRQPQVRGNWGEIALRNAVELAGMSKYCHDFSEQVQFKTDDGWLRPDMIVNLPGGRSLVIDAKTPLDHFRRAVAETDEKKRSELMKMHAQAVRGHIKDLSRKDYVKHMEQTPDFTIMFIPGESFFSAALEEDRTLIEDAIRDQVLLATPTTLVAMLRSIAFCWQQQEQEANVRKIAEAGMELYSRLTVFARHWSDVRKGLDQAGAAFADSVGSWNRKLIPAAERLKKLGAALPEHQLEELDVPHPLTHETPRLIDEGPAEDEPGKDATG